MLGGPTWSNFLRTGLWGPKGYISSKFPFLRFEQPNVPFDNFITGEVPASALRWPSGAEFVKGFLGQRVIDG